MGPFFTRLDSLIDRLPLSPRLFRFCVVGSSGVLVNFLVLALSLLLLPSSLGAWEHRVAMAAAIATSIFSNFVLNDIWTWADRRHLGLAAWLHRLGRFFLVSLLAAIIQWSTAIFLYEGGFVCREPGCGGIFLAQGSGIALAMLVNFTVNHFWTFAHHRERGEPAS